MTKLLRNLMLTAAGASAFLAFSPEARADAADAPLILTLRTNIYGYQGPTNSFTVYLGSTEKDTEFYVEGPKSAEYVYVDPYTLGNDPDGSHSTVATAVPLSVTEADGEVRIYGDASKLDFIDVHGCYLGAIDLSGNFVNLSVLDLSHNELEEIDLSGIPSLNSIDLTDNAFRVPEKMKIGTNHPDLIMLQVGINDVVDPELDLRNFPNLVYFSAYSNYGVTSIDPTQCPDLVSLQLDGTNISSIDVSKNLKLDVLNLSQTKVNHVDLSNNTALGEFYLNHDGSLNSADQYKLREIDLSKNVNLQYLDLGGNLLTGIDLSNNTKLVMLYLMRNYITGIDLSNCTRLAKVDLSNNCMNFATLPLPQYGWDYYYYQRPLPTEIKYKVGEPIDFSPMVIRAPYVDAEGNTITPATFAAVFVNPRAGNVTELETSKYTYEGGVLTFLEAVSDPVYVAFHCTAFEDWDIQTGSFLVKTPEEFDLPAVAFSFTPQNSLSGKTVSFRMGAVPTASGVSLPADVTLICGDNTVVLENAVNGSSLPESDNITFTLPPLVSTVKVALPDGLALSELAMDGILLSSVDFSPAEYMTSLTINDAKLRTIDLGYNRALLRLQLTGNTLTTVDLSGVRGDYEKWDLTTVDLSGNNLSNLILVSYETLRHLNLAGNRFSQFDAKYYTGLRSLDLSNNRLSGELDLSQSASLSSLNVSGNTITEVLVADWNRLDDIDLRDNSMSFATLPLISDPAVSYTYAPQNPIEILKKAPAINLSAQNVGAGTTYTWRYAGNGSEVPADKITDRNGAFLFDESLIGQSIYCEMTNPSFPDFDSQPLATTATTVASKPDVLVASFTPTRSGEAQIGFIFNQTGENAVYIDWRGDGTEFIPYIYAQGTTGAGIYQPGTAYAGKTAKVYTYTSAEDVAVFALNNTPLSDLDCSPMTRMTELLVHNAGLADGKIKLPESNSLANLVLDGSNLSSEDFSRFTGLQQLNLAGNAYTSFSLEPFHNLRYAILAQNHLESVDLGANKALYQVILEGNSLDEIDLSGTQIAELLLSDNNLTQIDLSPVKESLKALAIAGNRFTLATLPIISEEAPNLTYFDYFSQQPMEVEARGNTIDLSGQAMVNGQETTYRWFLGNKQSDVYYDYYYEMFVGEELEGPDVSSDPEYVVEGGVTTFLYPQSRKVICAMTNPQFPALILYTVPASIQESAVEETEMAEDTTVDVYSLTGVCLRRGVARGSALQGLAPGLYIVGDEKVLVR